ncbi:VWA domain-containing protein [Candidatus Thorarchaeota archaeon]|nr:MAG: VWA domain-containing protein [Candidatus Thorarchaeota archaeon]
MPMLHTTSEAFPAEKKMMSDIPYVLRVEFGALETEGKKIVGKPIACYKCNGFLLSVDQIVEDDKVGKHFICPFCGTLNVIEGEVITAGDDTDFVIEPPPDTTTSEGDALGQVGDTFLALIDVSGSMAGANLAAVKRSLRTSVESLAANAPDTMFGLIEFESSVLFRDLQSGNGIVLPRESYASFDDIQKETKRLMDSIKFLGVGDNSDRIKKHVEALRDQGGTALGPAVAMGYTIAKHRNIGRIVLLTDGLANEGIGALEGYQVTPADSFYEELGGRFMENGTAVDVVGIASGAGMELKTLGLLPEATGGQMYYVTPNELDRSIAELAGSSLLGRDVEVRLITPPGIRVKDASGVSRTIIEDLKKKGESKIGAVGENHEIYFEVEPESRIESDNVPIQVQVTYTDSEGARRVRAVTTKLKVAKDDEEILKTFDPTIGATFVTQKAGEESFRGERAEGKKRISSFRAAMKKQTKAAPKQIQSRIGEIDDVLAEEEEEMERLDNMMKAAPASAPSAAADEAYTSGLQQMRRSSKQMFRKKNDEEEEE